MMKYVIPTIKTESFHSENIVTGSGTNQEYIKEVETHINGMATQSYKTRAESATNLLQYTQ